MGGARLEETTILNKKYGLGYQAKAATPCPAIPGYLGHPSHEAVVATDELADIINPIIDRLELASERTNSSWNCKGRQGEEPAPLDAIHDHTATAKGCSSAAAARRLYSIRHKQSRCSTHSWAEAIFDALDIHEDLLVFPAGVTYAVEMAEAWADDELQAHRLVRSLVHFTRGFFADIDEVCEWVEGRIMVEGSATDNPAEKMVADQLSKLRLANRITPDEYREQMARLPELAAEVAA